MTQVVRSSGQFYGLPQYPEGGEKHSVLVVGANGITGHNVVKVLSEHPERWGDIYALSRKPPTTPVAGNVKHLSVDLLKSPVEIASGLAQAGPMYVRVWSWTESDGSERISG